MRRILTYLLAVLLSIALAIPVFAENTTNLVLSVKDGHTPLVGMEFEIHWIGRQSESGELIISEAFASYPVDITPNARDVGALYAFAKKDGLAPYAELRTDEAGKAIADDLQPGFYLIGGLPMVYNGYRYDTEPQLLQLPQKDPATGGVLQNAVLDVKTSREAGNQQGISRKVLKIWNDASGHKRPDSVTVHLMKNGSVSSSVILNADNQWRHTWDGLEANALWQIVEDVPTGYTVSIEQEGNAFVLTNSAPEFPPQETEPPEDPKPGGNIPQTGMILWPVFLLAGLGIVCIVAGILLRKDSAYEA